MSYATIHEAVQALDSEGTLDRLKANDNIHSRNFEELTPLDIARILTETGKECSKILDILIKAGAEDPHQFVIKGDIQAISNFLRTNKIVDLFNQKGETLLVVAVKNAQTKIVKLLLKNDADIDFINKYMLDDISNVQAKTKIINFVLQAARKKLKKQIQALPLIISFEIALKTTLEALIEDFCFSSMFAEEISNHNQISSSLISSALTIYQRFQKGYMSLHSIIETAKRKKQISSYQTIHDAVKAQDPAGILARFEAGDNIHTKDSNGLTPLEIAKHLKREKNNRETILSIPAQLKGKRYNGGDIFSINKIFDILRKAEAENPHELLSEDKNIEKTWTNSLRSI